MNAKKAKILRKLANKTRFPYKVMKSNFKSFNLQDKEKFTEFVNKFLR